MKDHTGRYWCYDCGAGRPDEKEPGDFDCLSRLPAVGSADAGPESRRIVRLQRLPGKTQTHAKLHHKRLERSGPADSKLGDFAGFVVGFLVVVVVAGRRQIEALYYLDLL